MIYTETRRPLTEEEKDYIGRVCVNCGSTEDIEYHHIVPLSLGGNDVLSNIQPLFGGKTGVKLTTKKSVYAKEIIRTHSKDFGGTLSDAECIRLAGISRNSFYKYKREIKEQFD